MKTHFIIAIAMIILAGCKSVPRNPCLWAIGNETEIVNKYNSRIDDLYDKHKKYEFMNISPGVRKPMLREDQKIKLVEVTPNGSKMRITFNNGETKISVQDEFNLSYLFATRFDYLIEPGSDSYSFIFCKIQLKKEDF